MADSENFDAELSEIISRLWEIDDNKCVPGEDYEIDLQGYVTSTYYTDRDRAREKLFSWLDEDKVFERDTYKAFRNLLDNYESETDKAEELTAKEIAESGTFINAIMKTKVMQEARQFLLDKERIPNEMNDFKQLLYDIWFKLYKRTREDRNQNSCGFEHVFVGETRDKDVIGFHNWIQFYLQEKRGNIDYRGFFRRGTANDEQPRLVTLQFFWKDEVKPIGSSFIGTSPEFEMALYTICHLMGESRRGNRVSLQVAEYEVEILCHGHGMGIGSAYPISNM